MILCNEDGASVSIGECLGTIGIAPPLFAALGDASTLSDEFKAIKSVYFRNVLLCHPDGANGDATEFDRLRDAFGRLKALYELSSVDSFADECTRLAPPVPSSFPPVSREYYERMADEPVPPYRVELAVNGRSRCTECLAANVSPFDAAIAKGGVRVGSLDRRSGSYARWSHLGCWRVPRSVWAGLPGAGGYRDTKGALQAVSEVALSGLSGLAGGDRLIFVYHCMDRKNWADYDGTGNEGSGAVPTFAPPPGVDQYAPSNEPQCVVPTSNSQYVTPLEPQYVSPSSESHYDPQYGTQAAPQYQPSPPPPPERQHFEPPAPQYAPPSDQQSLPQLELQSAPPQYPQQQQLSQQHSQQQQHQSEQQHYPLPPVTQHYDSSTPQYAPPSEIQQPQYTSPPSPPEPQQPPSPLPPDKQTAPSPEPPPPPSRPPSAMMSHVHPCRFELPRPGVNKAKPGALKGKRFTITGVFPGVGGGKGLKLGKSKVQAMIESFGGKVTPRVSDTTDILVMGSHPGYSKIRAARASPGVRLMSLRGLTEMLENAVSMEDIAPAVVTNFPAEFMNRMESSSSLDENIGGEQALTPKETRDEYQQNGSVDWTLSRGGKRKGSGGGEMADRKLPKRGRPPGTVPKGILRGKGTGVTPRAGVSSAAPHGDGPSRRAASPVVGLPSVGNKKMARYIVMSVAQLKDMLRGQNLSTTGNKAQLIQKLMDYGQ